MSESESAVDVDDLSAEQLDRLQERMREREIERDTSQLPESQLQVKPDPVEVTGWMDYSSIPDRILSETKKVEYRPNKKNRNGPGGQVRVTMERNGEQRRLTFSKTHWLKSGRKRLFDQYRTMFRENLRDLDEADWGEIRYRWIHYYLSTNGNR